jgi:hypothetical protein
MTVYTLTEDEPDSEFPSVVLGIYASYPAAEAHQAARIAQWEAAHGEPYDPEDNDEISWEIDAVEVREEFIADRDLAK